ncbi:MAG: glutaminyl-tRNA synthase (glutamine-hydrolyzing) subunit B [Omnitrophica WOR_2 bacterium RBG_13_44_8b]|nr:MAG: glutaminyl-tRNA synthase (glutamine-hydrolyzing) subunit B [Omnitrophica WOR_2 bacterium RBG_13_44_8b]
MEYEAVIGLEVHVHLKTKTKAFCGCSTEFGNAPNSQTCPVCLGFPGSLPVLNAVALDYAIKVAIALSCKVQEYTKFDRKNYFYPDLPKNYQISQYDLPLSRDGFLDIESEAKLKRVKIRRVHMEEDAGKLIHEKNNSLVDFNRAGMPLLEIVSEPDLNSPQEAYDYLASLKSILEYLEVSDCDMEKGSLRCDANISLKVKGASTLGTKTELKNMNSFKGVRDALSFEIERQGERLAEGQTIIQETRLWDVKESKTLPMRTKEEAQDYRYFPEPDLPPFIISDEKINEIKKSIPELPQEKCPRFIKVYGLSEYDAKILVASKKDAEFAEECFKQYQNKDKKPVANWLIGPLASIASKSNISISAVEIPGGKAEFIKLINLEREGSISNLVAKSVLSESVESKDPASKIIQEKNLIQISDSGSLQLIAEEVIKENSKSVNDYKQGKANALMFLVGQVMKKSQGKANPKVVQEILKRRLSDA